MSDNTNDKFNIEVSGTGAKIATAGHGANRLTNALADFVSPVTETTGLVGDFLRYARDETRLLHTLRLARKKLDAEDRPADPVSKKFLVQWIEGASYEEDDNLSELWANLLVNSSGTFDSGSVWAAGILRAIGSKEGALIETLRSRSARIHEWNMGWDGRYRSYYATGCNQINSAVRELEKVVEDGYQQHQDDFDYLSTMHDVLERQELYFIPEFAFSRVSTGEPSFSLTIPGRGFGWFEIEMLISLSLVVRVGSLEDYVKSDQRTAVTYTRLTPLGVKFLSLVQ